MKIDTMIRHVKEAFRSLSRNRMMTLSAISAVAVTLFIFGIFIAAAMNIQFLAKELDKQMALRASISPTATNDDIERLQKEIGKDSEVKSVSFVSKEEGLRRMKEQWGDDSDDFFRGLEGEDNPLPHMLVIVPQNPQEIKALAEKIENNNKNYIDQVDFGGGVTDDLLSFSSWIRNIVLVLGIGLAILSAFLISNTIKLTIFARRREIEIMRLVGASNWFIRWPFFIEGAVIGILGAIVPVGLVLLIYYSLLNALGVESSYSFFQLLPMWPLSLYIAGITIALGVIIGVWGSLISVRRFLRV